MSHARWLICAALTASSGLLGLNPAQEIERSVEHEGLTMFQMVARADIVVHVRVKEGAARFAIVEVRSALKGEPPGPQLRIDFRDLNLSPHGQAVVVFRPEEEYVLFLMKKLWRRPKAKNANILDLLHGRRGRMLLSPEGWEGTVDAVRAFVLLAQAGPEEQIDGLSALLPTDNPLLKEATLEELTRLRVAAPKDLPILVRLLGDPSPRIRSRALPLIALQFASAHTDDLRSTSDQREALASVLERARGDQEENVRVESVRTLGAWPKPEEVLGDLLAIARQDPAQKVRYEAERLLFRLKS